MSQHLHFVQSVEPLEGGGLGRAAIELHRSLLDLGEHSRLVTTHGGEPPPVDTPHIDQFARKGPAPFFYAPEMYRRAKELLRDVAFTHGHGFYVAPNWILGTRAAKRPHCHLVYHPHGMLEPWILQRSRFKKRAVHALFENHNFRKTSLWRALTQKEADQIHKLGTRAPIVVAPNGIHLEAFDLPPLRGLRPEKQARRLLFLGRLHPKKGIRELIQAWSALPAQLTTDWELLIAGPDELGHRAELEQLASAVTNAFQLKFLGTITGPAKYELLASSDLFILPSHSEGFSVAILEALASRLPVVATHACNFPDLEEKGAGWLCDSTNLSIKQTLERALACNDSERAQRGEAGRALVESAYTWPTIAHRLLDACRAQLPS